MRNYYSYSQMIVLTALLVVASLTICWGQDNLNVSVDCGTSTLTVSGYFSTNSHGMNILLFKDNAIVSVATDVAGPSINRTFGLSGSGLYYARAMEVNNDAHNINSASISVNCSSNQPSQPSSPPPSSPSNGSGGLNFQIVSYDCNSGTLQYQFTSGDGSSVNVTIPGVFGGTMNPNSVASYTFPGDARTGRTVTGTASQGGNQINISFTTSCNLTSSQQSGGSPPNTPSNPNPPSTVGNCNFSEGQFLFTFYGEQIYAHYYNGILFAAYQDGSGFKPQHWMQAASSTAGFDQTKVPCFSEQDPRTSGGGNNNPPTNNPPINNSPSGNPQAGSNMVGNLDGADCQAISGWVVNRNTPNRSAKFDVYINNWLVAVGVPTRLMRQDIANALGISNYNAFGFYMSIPNQYKSGNELTISVKYSGTNTDIPGSPRTTTACPRQTNPYGCNGDGASRIGYAESTVYSHSGGTALKLNTGKQANVSSLTSKLIAVRKNNFYSLDTYAYAPTAVKPNLAPQLTSAVIGGVLAGITLLKQPATPVDRSPQISHTTPILGVSAALMVPLVKSAFTKLMPKAQAELAFYNRKGDFIHRQKVSISKAARLDWEQLHIEGYAKEDGYVVVRLQNLSKEPAWFDDISFSQVYMSPSGNKQLFIPNVSNSLNDFAAYQAADAYTVFNCTKEDDPIEGGWLDVDVTVTASRPSSPQWYFGGGGSSGSGGSSGGDGGGSSSGGSESIFIPYGAPQNPPKNTVYTSPSGASYVYDGKSWCIVIKPVDVKGMRPTNPAEEEFYIYADPDFGYITEYEYINGRWTQPLRDFNENAALPDRIKRAKQSPNSEACTTFKAMWDRQNNVSHKEQGAFITDKGIFWLPDDQNQVDQAVFGAQTEYGGEPGKKWFVYNNVVYNIRAMIHTHPVGIEWNDAPSNNDKKIASSYGIPNYVISDNGVYKVDKTGFDTGIIDHYLSHLFDCNQDQNIVGEIR